MSGGTPLEIWSLSWAWIVLISVVVQQMQKEVRYLAKEMQANAKSLIWRAIKWASLALVLMA